MDKESVRMALLAAAGSLKFVAMLTPNKFDDKAVEAMEMAAKSDWALELLAQLLRLVHSGKGEGEVEIVLK